MAECRFSIIVPVYNVEKYLKRCLASLLAQEYEKYEILLIDDGSTDGSGAMCDQYAKEYPVVKAFHKPNGGLSSARNYGIERASGEYVLFVDSDDYVKKSMCWKLDERLTKRPGADMVSFDGIEETEKDREKIRRIPLRDVTVQSGHDFLLECYKTRNLNVQAWLYAYRKEFLDKKKLRFKEGILHEDVEFMPRAILNAENILAVPDALYIYVIREGSISTQKDKSRNIKDLSATLKTLDSLADKQDPELSRWMKNAVLNSYLNMVMEFEMYRPKYRKLLDKSFLKGKAATSWNRVRVVLCGINAGWYCKVNKFYKKIREK